MVDIWKDITEYKGMYQVSNHGKVRSLDRISADGKKLKGRELRLVSNGYGYYTVGLTRNGITKRYYIHRLVYEAFIGKILNSNDINHIDHDKSNNAPHNLESITHHDNLKDQAIYANGVYKDSHNYEGLNNCPICGSVINYKSKMCKHCTDIKKTSHRIPKNDIIKSLTKSRGNFTKSAKEFNISDNALRKWCRKYKLPSRSSQWQS